MSEGHVFGRHPASQIRSATDLRLRTPVVQPSNRRRTNLRFFDPHLGPAPPNGQPL